MVQQDVILNVIPFFRILGIHLIILVCVVTRFNHEIRFI